MWLNDEVQAALVGGAAVDQHEEVLVEALRALRNLSCAAENQVAMWLHIDVRATLVRCAAVDQGPRRCG